MRFAFLAVAAALVVPLASAAAPSPAIDYVVTAIVTDDSLRGLRVDMRFEGDADGETEIALPTVIADQNELWRGVEDFNVQGATMEAPAPERRVLHHRPRARISVSYLVRQSFDAELVFGPLVLRPIVQHDWYAVQGEGLFAQVLARPDARVRFRWGRAPAGWTNVTDAEQTPGREGGAFEVLRESILIGGKDVRIVESRAAGGRLRVASIGAPGFDTQHFLNAFAPAAASAARDWQDEGRDYLVAVIPVPPEPNVDADGQLGWSRRDGFAIYLTPRVNETQLVHTVVHEFLHSWFPVAFGRLANEAYGYEAEVWFDEGFADYFTDRALLASGVWSLEDFAAQYQEVTRDYWNSPARNMTGEALGRAFWEIGPVQKMAYLRGALLAALWDYRLKAATGGRSSLLAVLRQVKAMHDEQTPVTRLRSAMRRAGFDIEPDMTALAAGANLDLPVDLFGRCISVRTEQTADYARGFPVTQAGQAVANVDPDGPAYAAGFRNGMIILGRDAGTFGDSRVEQVWRVRDGATERVLRFMPRGHGVTTMHDVIVTPNLSAEERARCVSEIVDSPRV